MSRNSQAADRITGELDAEELETLLQQDVERTLGRADPPTVTLERERLRGLLEESSDAKPIPLAHTVPRDEVTRRPTKPHLYVVPYDEIVDMDIRPSMSPVAILGVIAVLFALFFAIMQVN